MGASNQGLGVGHRHSQVSAHECLSGKVCKLTDALREQVTILAKKKNIQTIPSICLT